MKIHRLNTKTVALEEIDPFLAGLLREIPARADPGQSPAVRERLFPKPTAGGEPEADAEWVELVEPELHELFVDALGVVDEDLQDFPDPPDAEGMTLRLPVKHLEAWIHALNQARLALVARHGFTEREIEREFSFEGGERADILFRIQFYGVLQELFLRQLE